MEDQDLEEDVAEDQPMVTEEQPMLDPTPEQVLQQLQNQLQSMQQERDRLVVAFAASQRVVQASLQAAEIREQLAILQAEIQRMQPCQPLSNTSNQHHLANQSQPNPLPDIATQPTFGTPYALPIVQRAIDSNSPLSKGIQNSPWPPLTNPSPYPNSMGE
jgi:hypothetical protein